VKIEKKPKHLVVLFIVLDLIIISYFMSLDFNITDNLSYPTNSDKSVVEMCKNFIQESNNLYYSEEEFEGNMELLKKVCSNELMKNEFKIDKNQVVDNSNKMMRDIEIEDSAVTYSSKGKKVSIVFKSYNEFEYVTRATAIITLDNKTKVKDYYIFYHL